MFDTKILDKYYVDIDIVAVDQVFLQKGDKVILLSGEDKLLFCWMPLITNNNSLSIDFDKIRKNEIYLPKPEILSAVERWLKLQAFS